MVLLANAVGKSSGGARKIKSRSVVATNVTRSGDAASATGLEGNEGEGARPTHQGERTDQSTESMLASWRREEVSLADRIREWRNDERAKDGSRKRWKISRSVREDDENGCRNRGLQIRVGLRMDFAEALRVEEDWRSRMAGLVKVESEEDRDKAEDSKGAEMGEPCTNAERDIGPPRIRRAGEVETVRFLPITRTQGSTPVYEEIPRIQI
jgi:hypothetical protein